MANMTTTRRPALPLWRMMLWGGAALALLTPLVAMRMTPEVAWSGGDFIVAAVLLGGAALAIEVAIGWAPTTFARALAIGGIVTLLTLVWVQLAVGLI